MAIGMITNCWKGEVVKYSNLFLPFLREGVRGTERLINGLVERSRNLNKY